MHDLRCNLQGAQTCKIPSQVAVTYKTYADDPKIIYGRAGDQIAKNVGIRAGQHSTQMDMSRYKCEELRAKK